MKYLILDLETVPISNAADFIVTDDIEAPEHYVKPDAIARFVEKEKTKRLEKAALDMDLARICSIAMAMSESTIMSTTCSDEHVEHGNLIRLAEELDPRNNVTLITFNGHRFDLPLLMRRAKYLGIPFPRINLDRYRSPHIDLYDELTLKGQVKAHSLRWYMRRLGWTDLIDADPLKDGGSDVATACAEGRWDDIAAHAKVDVTATLRLAQWLGVVPSKVPETAGAF